jgi:hypothetical protein
LKYALKIDLTEPRTEDLNIAGTHLNTCAIYSKLGKHKEAIHHAKCAIKILEKLISEKEESFLKYKTD